MKNLLNQIAILLAFALINIPYISHAQLPSCDASVPFYSVNLTGKPNGSWISPSHSRIGHCCGTTGSDNCTSFEITLDPNAAQISFDVNSGAMPSGSLYYQINCGPEIPVGQKICLSGIGPHRITFCKPGNNENTYILTSYPKPIFPADTTVRIGCTKTLPVLGITANTITWNSIYPGTSGQYNSYLSCTNCLSPAFTPVDGAPAYIDYKICGFPEASTCGLNFTVCDTVRIYTKSRLAGTVSPSPASFCQSGPGSGVTLTANPAGGAGNYTYIWRNNSLVNVGTNQNYFATTQENFTVEIRDGLYNPSTCPSQILNVPVSLIQLPVVNAGPDQTVCATDARVNLNGTVSNAVGATWSGGNGTFSPGPGNLTPTYWPTSSEIASGTLKLYLKSNNSGNCPQVIDTIKITFPNPLQVTISSGSPSCSGSISMLHANVSGGISPYNYSWNTGSVSSSISVPPGTYCATVIDNMGCNTTICKTITAPSPLSITMSSTNLSVNGGSNGTATAAVSGGSSSYTYLWSNGGTTSTITGLTYGVYKVAVTDLNGCKINGSVVVNEPRCLGFSVTSSHTNLACYGNSNATATAVPVGGTAPYSYLWDDINGQNTAQAVNLSNGTFTVSVTDANSCITSTSLTIAMPSPIVNTMTYSDVTNISGDNGSASANPFGGTSPYKYSWGNGATTQTISNLTSGIYHVNITDNNGCIFNDSVLIEKGNCSNLRISVVSTELSCFGSANGTATAFVNIGTAPYQYLWSNGATTNSINNLPAGIYSVRVTDATACYTFKTINVLQPAKLSLGLSPTDVICNGQNNGTIETTVSGGTYPYSFNWSNGSNTEDLIYLAPANYAVNVLDTRGCAISGSVLVKQPAPLTTAYTMTNPTCNGGSNGSIDITVTGGMIPYSYSWSNGMTSQDLSSISSGSYIIKVNDANGCKLSSDIDIIVGQPAIVAVDSVTIPCNTPGSDKTIVTMHASGGNGGPYQISFDNGATYLASGTYNAELLIGSIYKVMVKDGNNCSTPTTYSLSINPGVQISSVSFNKCIPLDSAQTSVTVAATGGDGGPYRVSFDNGSTFEAQGIYSKKLPVGSSYLVLVKDQKGCISVSSSIHIPSPLSLNVSSGVYSGGFNVSCHGNSDASITTTVAGGTQPVTFNWNGPGSYTSNLQSISGINAGNYTIIVTDSNGCIASKSITLTQPDSLSALATTPVVSGGFNVNCDGSNNGSINLSVSGGDSTTYSYSWTGPNGFTSSSKSPSGLGAGTYSVVITDANNCSVTKSATLTQPDSLSVVVSSPMVSGGFNITCNGASNGSINLSVAGGDSTTYSYSWTGPNGFTSNSKSLSGLASGTYNLVLTDANSCSMNKSITLTQPDSLSALAASPMVSGGFNITCNGASNGSINLSVAGGDSTTYSYRWTGPNGFTSNSKSLSGLGAGTYNLVLTDANSCSMNKSITLIQPDSLSALAGSPMVSGGFNITCNGASNGGINLSVAGGDSTTYSYSWTGPNGFTSNSKSLNRLGAGTYNLVLTDANGCSASNSINLTQPDSLSVLAASPMVSGGFNITCNGANNGSINLSVAGGDSTTYSYSWTGPNGYNSSSKSLNGLGAGTYNLVVNDLNGCSASTSIAITKPDSMVINSSLSQYTLSNVSCHNAKDGAIKIHVTGGDSTTYSFTWSGPGGFSATTENISSLYAGSYTLSVSDANGCSASAPVQLNQPDSLISSAAVSSNFNGNSVSCAGSADGMVDLTVIGGTLPYIYSWSNGASIEDLTALATGNYTVTVTDQNGCQTISSIGLTEPQPISASTSTVDVLCNGFSTGSIDLSISGGVNPYQQVWSNGANTEDITNLTAGNYSVVITDKNQCTYSISASVNEQSPVILSVSSTNESCYESNNGTAMANVSGGSAPYTFDWSNGANTVGVSGLQAGTYTVTVIDNNQCYKSDTIVISQPDSLKATVSSPVLANGHNVSFYQGKDGAVQMKVIGGTVPYSYTWSTGVTTQDVSNLTAGNYNVLITDTLGCKVAASISLTEPDDLAMPTGYSPNLDGQNDLFLVHGLEAYPNNKIVVVNRWGNTVYKAEPYKNNWNGLNSSGEEIPDGTYFVVLTINGGEIVLKNFVDVRR